MGQPDYEVLVDSDENEEEDGLPLSLTGIEYFEDIQLRTLKTMNQIIIEAANYSLVSGHLNHGRKLPMFSYYEKPIWSEPLVTQ